MRAQIGESLLVERMIASLSAASGLLATLLAALGLYGAMSDAVSLRTREISIRALGAERNVPRNISRRARSGARGIGRRARPSQEIFAT